MPPKSEPVVRIPEPDVGKFIRLSNEDLWQKAWDTIWHKHRLGVSDEDVNLELLRKGAKKVWRSWVSERNRLADEGAQGVDDCAVDAVPKSRAEADPKSAEAKLAAKKAALKKAASEKATSKKAKAAPNAEVETKKKKATTKGNEELEKELEDEEDDEEEEEEEESEPVLLIPEPDVRKFLRLSDEDLWQKAWDTTWCKHGPGVSAGDVNLELLRQEAKKVWKSWVAERKRLAVENEQNLYRPRFISL